MRSISLYENLSTPIHHIEPLSKILYIIVTFMLPIIWEHKGVTIGCIAVSIILLIVGKVLLKTLPVLGCSSVLIITIIIIQSLFRAGNVTPLFKVGSVIFYKEGFHFALGVGLNLINLLSSVCILILTTKPSDLVEALVRIGLSPKIGYVLGSVFQIIPQMSATMNTIIDAQRSRGMETEGDLRTRIKAFFPLMGPVVMNSLISTRERAIALEVRGFNCTNKRSYLNVYEPTKIDRISKIVLVVILGVSIVGRMMGWQQLL